MLSERLRLSNMQKVNKPVRQLTQDNFIMKYLLSTLCNGTRSSVSFIKRFKSSQEWLVRQMKDPYVEKARIMNYRCRSSFKLLEINERHKILKPGDVVIDIGAAPGSFSQVCVRAVNSDGLDRKKPKGIVIGIDRLQIYKLDGATFLGGMDFKSQQTQEKLKELLGERKANVVVSDMAPNCSGIRSLDYDNIMELANSVFNFAKDISAENATLLIKVWDNPEVRKLQDCILNYYEICKSVKPQASRTDSAEKFILARGFRNALKESVKIA